MTIGTLFTLFVVPSVYVLIAQNHRKKHGLPTSEPPPAMPEPSTIPPRVDLADGFTPELAR